MNLLYNEILPITGTIQWWGAILCFDFLPVLKGEADVVDAEILSVPGGHAGFIVQAEYYMDRMEKFLKKAGV